MILVVDDHEDTCQALATYIQLEGYSVLTARDGEEALLTLQNADPEAVILDNHMPGISGETVLRAIRSSERHRNVPVLMFTGDDRQEIRERLEALGVTKLLGKCCDWGEISSEIKDIITKRN